MLLSGSEFPKPNHNAERQLKISQQVSSRKRTDE